MVVLNKIYTKTGDDGTTALSTGARRHKYDMRVEAYGTVDETNAALGMVRQALDDFADLDAMILRIQNDLFDLGADLATPDTGEELAYEPLRIVSTQVEQLEADIDTLNKDLAPLRSFILPGGSQAASLLHTARTIARRGERLIVALSQKQEEPINPLCIHYMNRLSDFLFVAARHTNNRGQDDILWVPGKNR